MHHGFDERGLPLRDYQEEVSRIWLSAAGQCALVSALGIWIAVLKGAFDVITWTRPREGVALLGLVSALLGLALLTKRRAVQFWCFLFALGALVAVLAWKDFANLVSQFLNYGL
jgi:hypothetical protein